MTFKEFMEKNYPYYENAGKKNIEMWEEIWNGGINNLPSLNEVKSFMHKEKMLPNITGTYWAIKELLSK